MQKIKCAVLTTVDISMSWFMIPYVYELKKRGYDITLICNMSDEFANQYKDDFNLVAIDLDRGFHLGKTLKAFFTLRKLFVDNNFDFVEFATENVSLPASMAAWFSKVPIRVYNHWGALFVGFSGIKRIITKAIEFTISLFSTHIRQVSQKNLELCVKNHLYSAKKAKVLGYGGTIGVDFSVYDLSKKQEYRKTIRKEYGIPENFTLMGYVGRIQADKGINELIESFMRIYNEDNNRYLMLVGPIDSANPIKDENMKWAENCSNVVFTDKVNDVYRYMSAFDLLVHPTYREGFGLVLQEAAALKTPIITTNIIGPSEFITHGFNGALAEPRDTESLYMCVKELLSAPEKMTEYAENGYQYTLENFERSVMVNRMVADREELLKGIGKI